MRQYHRCACLRYVSHRRAKDMCVSVSPREFGEGAIVCDKRPLNPDVTAGIM